MPKSPLKENRHPSPPPGEGKEKSGRRAPLDFAVFPRRWNRLVGIAVGAFVVIGLAARLIRFLLRFPL